MSFHSLDISFPLEYQPPSWKHKPARFIAHLIGHEGPGSLCSHLKNKGWITGIRSESQELGRGFAIFRITCQLTRDGFSDLSIFPQVVLATKFQIYSELPICHPGVLQISCSFTILRLSRISSKRNSYTFVDAFSLSGQEEAR
jgi:hypothetical protein